MLRAEIFKGEIMENLIELLENYAHKLKIEHRIISDTLSLTINYKYLKEEEKLRPLKPLDNINRDQLDKRLHKIEAELGVIRGLICLLKAVAKHKPTGLVGKTVKKLVIELDKEKLEKELKKTVGEVDAND